MTEKKNITDPADDDSTEVKVEHLQPEQPADGVKTESTDEATAESSTEERAKEVTVEIDWEDRFLRLAAEFDNYKKRSVRQYAQIIKSAEEQLIAELTEVLDNLERALDPEHRDARLEEFVKGVDLIYGQFKAVLEKRGLTRIVAVGEPFDPEKHEAMVQINSDDVPEGYVAGEVSPGYMLGERVLRHSKVMVSGGPAKRETEAETDSTEEKE